MKLTDTQLVKKCLKGEPRAQRALYEQYKVPMYRLCLRYANDRATAEDFLQDGFIKVFADLKKYSGKGAFGGWIRKVMVNTALMHLRKNKRLFPVVSLENVADDYATEEDVFAKMGAKALTQIIQQLPDGYRVVFNMYVVEGYSHKEIAEQLGITVSTSKSQLSKSKAQLRKLVGKKAFKFA